MCLPPLNLALFSTVPFAPAPRAAAAGAFPAVCAFRVVHEILQVFHVVDCVQVLKFVTELLRRHVEEEVGDGGGGESGDL